MDQEASFNTWTIGFLIAAAQGFFIAFVLWHWKRGIKHSNRLLALLVMLFSITLLEYVLFWTRYLYHWPHWANISIQFPFLTGPIIWLYLRSIFEGKKPSIRDAWLILPFIAGLILFLPCYFSSSEIKIKMLKGEMDYYWNATLMNGQLYFRIIWQMGFAVWNAIYIFKQPAVGDTRKWATLLNGFFAVFALAYTSYFILINFSFFNLSWDYHISALMTAMIYLIAYAGYVQPAVFEGFKWKEANVPAKYKNSGLSADASQSLVQHLILLMREEKAYQDPDLNLDKLASLLGASKHHVSQIINEHLGESFFEYINRLRVEEAKELLASTTRSDLHVIEVAYTVGFNNKVSFNAAFKKATGMTPTEYRKNHASSDSERVQPQEAR
jgi:AraC-like DNA-binding protein